MMLHHQPAEWTTAEALRCLRLATNAETESEAIEALATLVACCVPFDLHAEDASPRDRNDATGDRQDWTSCLIIPILRWLAVAGSITDEQTNYGNGDYRQFQRTGYLARQTLMSWAVGLMDFPRAVPRPPSASMANRADFERDDWIDCLKKAPGGNQSIKTREGLQQLIQCIPYVTDEGEPIFPHRVECKELSGFADGLGKGSDSEFRSYLGSESPGITLGSGYQLGSDYRIAFQTLEINIEFAVLPANANEGTAKQLAANWSAYVALLRYWLSVAAPAWMMYRLVLKPPMKQRCELSTPNEYASLPLGEGFCCE